MTAMTNFAWCADAEEHVDETHPASECPYPVPTCIQKGSVENPCAGNVEYRMPLSGTGKSFPRCDKHWSDRLDVEQRINERYPDSPIPPADFDPTYAGESWNDDY